MRNKNMLTESILTELDRSNIMSDQNVIDICKAFSSRMNLNYKLEGNSAVYEDGTIIKFIVNDDDEIEYYCINKQGDKSTTALVKDWKLLDLLTEGKLGKSLEDLAKENNVSQEDIDIKEEPKETKSEEVLEEPTEEKSTDLNTQFRGKAKDAAKLFNKVMNDKIIHAHQQSMAEIAESLVYQMINAATYGFSDEEAHKIVDNIINNLK